MFISFRVISALAGAGVFTIVGGSLSDLFIPEERATSMSFFAATVIMGPCIGPVFGSLIADNLNWYVNSKVSIDIKAMGIPRSDYLCCHFTCVGCLHPS